MSPTDADGKFLFRNPPAKPFTLVFSFVGYRTREVAVGNNTNLKVELTEEASQMNDVVVIGYGSANRKDLTSSISSVKGSDLAVVPVTNLDAALQGKVAGVQVVQNSGAPGDETLYTYTW